MFSFSFYFLSSLVFSSKSDSKAFSLCLKLGIVLWILRVLVSYAPQLYPDDVDVCLLLHLKRRKKDLVKKNKSAKMGFSLSDLSITHPKKNTTTVELNHSIQIQMEIKRN
jgi:hypothetical protein